MENILKTYNLTRKYGTTAVVDNINMNIKKEKYTDFGKKWCRKDNNFENDYGTYLSNKRRI